jgi:SAM-dependent methyltransferase
MKKSEDDIVRERRRDWNRLDARALWFQHSRERAISHLLRPFGRELEEWKVLDIGCGTGRLMLLLNEMNIGRHGLLTGYDVNKTALNSSVTKLGLPLTVTTENSLPYDDVSFDLIMQAVVFSSVPREETRKLLAAEIVRVLKPGGYILWYDVIKTAGTLVGFGRRDIDTLFPGFRFQGFRCGLPFGLAGALCYKSQVLASLVEASGLSNSHIAALLKKDGVQKSF